MTELLIVIAIGVGIYFIWKPKNTNKPARNFDATNQDNSEQNMLNLTTGSIIKINNAGENLEDLDLKILAKHLYKQGSYKWHEYECLAGSEKYFISVENDDELEIALTLKKLKLKDIGVSKSELKKIDDNENGKIIYNGKTYHYDDSDNATYCKNSDESQRQEFYYWEFEDDDEEFFITVENWGGSHEVSYGKYLEPRQIDFYN